MAMSLLEGAAAAMSVFADFGRCVCNIAV